MLVAGGDVKIKEVKVPFRPDDVQNRSPLCNPTSLTGDECPWYQYTKDDAYILHENKDKLPESTVTHEAYGVLAKVAASVLMKCLCAARVARFDLLRPVQGLARYLTKWGKRQDEELYQLMCYIYTTRSWKTVGWIADKFEDLVPHLFTYADLLAVTKQ